MTTLRVLFADDEPMARRRLSRLLAAMSDVELVAACASAEELLTTLVDADADVVLLDVRMPGLDGLEARALIPEDGPAVILVSAHPEHALTAFDVGVVDYVPKPVEAARLRKALDRARVRAAPDAHGATPLAVETREGVRLVDPSHVTHVTLEHELAHVHTTTDGTLVTTRTLAELSARLPRMLRVHRTALLDLSHVRTLIDNGAGGYEALIDGGAKVPVSRQAGRRLRRRLGL